jgi:uncharacterized membrane protein YvlD (DUF360 family)
MLRKMLWGIVIYSFIMYMIVEFWPVYDFQAISLDPENSLRSTPFFLLIWWIFWFMYDILRRLLKLLTLPFNWITFWFVHTALNIWTLYAFGYVVNALELWIQVTMWSLIEVVILSFLLWIVWFFIKYI